MQEDVPAHPSVSLPYFEERSSAERDGPSSSLSGVAQTLPDAAAVGQRVPPTCGVAYETPLVLRSTGFQVQTNEPSSPPGKEKQVDYYANVGDAIRTLRDDIPQLFVKDLNCK